MKRIINGLFWTYSERMLAQLITLVVTVILARLLSPEDYGAISIVIIFIQIADTFAINGLGNALIQKKNADHLDFSSVFYFNIAFSIILYLFLFLIANPIAIFYKNETLKPVLRVMSLRIPIAAINSVQQAYVAKRMDFKRFFYATLAGTLISAVIGIAMAYMGFGVWALVAQYMSNTIIDTIVLWYSVMWRPRLEYSWQRMRMLYSYGWGILATSLLINIYGNIQDLIIGKKFSSVDLAFSNKGRQFPSLISSNINTSISKVLFPALAEIQEDKDRVKILTRRSISVGTYLLSPILIGLMAIAKPFVRVLLTDKWLPCVPYLQIMCIVFLLQPIQTASIQTMKAMGKSNLYFQLEIIKKIGNVTILVISVICFNSVFAIIMGSLISELFSTIINIPVNKRLINYSYCEQADDILPTIILSIIMAIFVIILGNYSKYFFNVDIALSVQIFLGCVIYLLLSSITKNKNFTYVKNLLIENIVNRRKT